MSQLESFQDIIIYILEKKWSSENWSEIRSYRQKWKNISYLFGLRVEHRTLKFMNDDNATVLDFNLLLESKEKKINITFYNGAVSINYLNRVKGTSVWRDGTGKMQSFEDFEGRNNIEKSKEIINWMGTWLTMVYNKLAKNFTSNYSFGSLRYI